jgi:hypothetical protein
MYIPVTENTLWHIAIDVTYEGKDADSCQDGVNKVLSVLTPLIENGSGFKQFLIMRLPAKVAEN